MDLNRRQFLATGAASLALLGGHGGARAAERPNVVLIVMDTTRLDRCSAYGYKRDTTPFLRELAQEATRFTNVYSTSCWTVPAHGSLYTGNYPIRHGATQENLSLAASNTTLAEVFAAHGYSTLGIAENAMLLAQRGFAQGFAIYHEAFRMRKHAQYGHIAQDLFAQGLKERDREKPFFAFVNLIAPHAPYTPPLEFREKFLPGVTPKVSHNRWREHYLGLNPFTPEQLKQLRCLYDGEVAFADYTVRKIAESLKEAGQWDNTVFVVTSDHGENIGDHGHMDHVFCLYDTVTRVPLVIRDPRHAESSTDDRPVQMHDLFPTLLALAGIPTAPHTVHGKDVMTAEIAADRPLISEYYYPAQALRGYREAQRVSPKLAPYRRRIRSVVQDGLKYIWGSDGRHEFYNLTEDAGEAHNVIEGQEFAQQREAMDAALKEWLLTAAAGTHRIEHPQMIDEGIDDDARDALETLGYL